jgi:hypothetical protein
MEKNKHNLLYCENVSSECCEKKSDREILFPLYF